MEPLRSYLRKRTGRAANAPIESGELLLGNLGTDQAAWHQGSAFVRASLWFLLGRQSLTDHQDDVALNAFSETRSILRQGGLLPRPPLLSSIALISGRILMDRSELDAADDAFRTAALVDPDDNSEQLPEGPARARYQAARHWIQEAPRLPILIEASGNGVKLYDNGNRINGPGPVWLVELPPGEHLLTAVRDGAVSASASVRLEPNLPRPRVQLSLEPGSPCSACLQPFSLGEATGLLDRVRSILESRAMERMVIEAVARPVLSKQPERPGPRVGVQAGIRINPGPDAGDEPPPPGPVEVELFRIDSSGKVFRLSSGEVGPM